MKVAKPRGVDGGLFSLLALPFVLLYFNRSWIFSPSVTATDPIGTIDPWVYNNQALIEKGFGATLLSQQTIGEGTLQFTLTFIRVDSPAEAVPGRQ